MRIVPLLFAATCPLFAGAPAHAEPTWQSIIGGDLVRIVDNKWVMEEHQICSVKAPGTTKSSIQIRSYAEAPMSAGISRDFMVSFASTWEALAILGISAMVAQKGAANPLEALDCNPITSPIGKVDLELNIFMTGEGFQFELVETANNKTVRESKRWAEVFESD